MLPPGYRSFLVRLWREAGADGAEQWCGEVEQIQSGHMCRFASLDALLALLRPTADTAETQAVAPEPPLSIEVGERTQHE